MGTHKKAFQKESEQKRTNMYDIFEVKVEQITEEE